MDTDSNKKRNIKIKTLFIIDLAAQGAGYGIFR